MAFGDPPKRPYSHQHNATTIDLAEFSNFLSKHSPAIQQVVQKVRGYQAAREDLGVSGDFPPAAVIAMERDGEAKTAFASALKTHIFDLALYIWAGGKAKDLNSFEAPEELQPILEQVLHSQKALKIVLKEQVLKNERFIVGTVDNIDPFLDLVRDTANDISKNIDTAVRTARQNDKSARR